MNDKELAAFLVIDLEQADKITADARKTYERMARWLEEFYAYEREEGPMPKGALVDYEVGATLGIKEKDESL